MEKHLAQIRLAGGFKFQVYSSDGVPLFFYSCLLSFFSTLKDNDIEKRYRQKQEAGSAKSV